MIILESIILKFEFKYQDKRWNYDSMYIYCFPNITESWAGEFKQVYNDSIIMQKYNIIPLTLRA